MSLNYIVLQGEILNSPEKKHTQEGTAVVTFNISIPKNSETDSYYHDGDIRVSASKKLAEKAVLIPSGTIVTIEGRLYTRTIETRSGNKQKIPYIQASNIEIIKEPQKDYYFSPTEHERNNDHEEDIPF